MEGILEGEPERVNVFLANIKNTYSDDMPTTTTRTTTMGKGGRLWYQELVVVVVVGVEQRNEMVQGKMPRQQ